MCISVHCSCLFSGINAVNVTVQTRTEHSVILLCELACFSEDLKCNFTSSSVDYTIGNVTGSHKSYTRPFQMINITNLASDTTYYYCVHAINEMNKTVGKLQCDYFTTTSVHGM